MILRNMVFQSFDCFVFGRDFLAYEMFLQRIVGIGKPQFSGLTGIVGVSEKEKQESRKKAVVRM